MPARTRHPRPACWLSEVHSDFARGQHAGLVQSTQIVQPHAIALQLGSCITAVHPRQLSDMHKYTMLFTKKITHTHMHAHTHSQVGRLLQLCTDMHAEYIRHPRPACWLSAVHSDLTRCQHAGLVQSTQIFQPHARALQFGSCITRLDGRAGASATAFRHALVYNGIHKNNITPLSYKHIYTNIHTHTQTHIHTRAHTQCCHFRYSL